MVLVSIGAGKEQIPGIKKAKEKGHYVIAIDGNPLAKGLNLADESHVLDIKNKESIIKLLKDKNMAGVIQNPIGRYLTTIGHINDKLNLKGISEKAAEICTDKVLTNKVLNNKVKCARQIVCKGKEQVLSGIKTIDIPCIIKPRFGSGSKGVRVINKSLGMVETLVEDHLNEIDGDDTLVESILLGQEYGVDAIACNGKVKLILIREKLMTEGLYRQEIGYIMPANLNNDMYTKIEKVIKKAANLIGLENCLINADIMIDNENISIIEISGRPGGLNISSKLIPYSTEIDFFGLGIDMILEDYDVDKIKINHKKVYSQNFINLKNGIIKTIPNKQFINNEDRIVEYCSDLKVGQVLVDIKNGKDAIDRGFMILRTDSYEEADELYKKIISLYEII